LRKKEGGPFLREEGVKRIPPLIELPKLLSAAEAWDGRERHRGGNAHAVCARLLSWRREAQGFRQGKGRPSRHREIPRKDDEINTVVWEAVALSLAQKFGIPVPLRDEHARIER
jgi:serine/threonine-protein kinase HipA